MLFEQLMYELAENVESRIGTEWEDGHLDREELKKIASQPAYRAEAYRRTCEWFAEAYDDDLTREEYNISGAPDEIRNTVVHLCVHQLLRLERDGVTTQVEFIDTDTGDWKRDTEAGDFVAHVVTTEHPKF